MQEPPELDEIEERLKRFEEELVHVKRVAVFIAMAHYFRNGETGTTRDDQEIISANSTELTSKIAQRLEETEIEELDILMKLLKNQRV